MSTIDEILSSQLKQRKEETTYLNIFGDEEKLNILIHVDESELKKYELMPQFGKFFQYPYSERLYEERCKNECDYGIKPEDMKWKKFYEKVLIAKSQISQYENSPRIRAEMKSYIQMCDFVMLQLYYILAPNLRLSLTNSAFEGDCLDIVQWLVENKYEEIDEMALLSGLTLGSLNCLKYAEYVNPGCINDEIVEYAFYYYNPELYKWLQSLGLQFNDQCYINALIKDNEDGVRWLLEQNVPFNNHVIRLAREKNISLEL